MEAFPPLLMERIRPAEDACASQPVEPRRAAKALLNVEDSQTPAVAVSWQSVELARAAIIAIAVAELAPLDLPLDHGMPSSTPHSGSEVYRARGRFRAVLRASFRSGELGGGAYALSACLLLQTPLASRRSCSSPSC